MKLQIKDSHKKLIKEILIGAVSVIVIFLIYVVVSYINDSKKNPEGRDESVVYINGEPSYMKIIGLESSSMFMSLEDKKKNLKDSNIVPKSLLLWYPNDDKSGTVKIIDTDMRYRSYPIKDECEELAYKIENNKLLLSKDGTNWEPLIIKSIPLSQSYDEKGINIPYKHIELKTPWFEGVFSMSWDFRQTLAQQREYVEKNYPALLKK